MDVLRTKFKNGSTILVKTLLREKIEYLFGYPGGAIMPIYDALHQYSNHIFHILSRHEQGAIHAAQGYARVSRKIGVCMSTSGPGATNLITGLADAITDNTPVICICGQVASHLLGKNSFQEINIIDISITVTKWNAQILLTQDIGIILQKAFYIVNYERNAPILIDITKDAQMKSSSFDDSKYKIEYYKIDCYCPYININFSIIEKSYKLIKVSKKPFVLVGQGVVLSNAEKEFKYFIEKADLPVGSTLLGLDIIDSNHPLFMGMLGMHGSYATNILTNQCDLIIAIGIRFDDRVTGDIDRYARQAKVIHMDIDNYEIGKLIHCNISVIGDCKKNLSLLTEKVRKTTKKSWIDIFDKIKKLEEEIIIRDLYNEDNELSMGEVIKYINMYKDKNAILVTDVGQNQMFTCRYFNFSYRKSQITSGGLGTMGFSMPASIGAEFGKNNRQIICIAGDGGLQMTIQEFGTIMQNKLTMKIFLLNNRFLGMVRQWQELFFEKRYAFTKLINPDFVKIANSYNIKSEKVSDRTSLKKEVKKILEFNSAFFLEIFVKKDENVFPMIATGNSVDEIRLN